MLYDGVNMPIVKLDTIVEHDGGQVPGEEESKDETTDEEDGDDVLIQDLGKGEQEDDGKTETKKRYSKTGNMTWMNL